MIVDLTLGGAAYAVVPVTEVWGGIEDLTAQRSAIGTVQAQRRNDGASSFAIARQDSGIVNWVDLGGLSEAVVPLRWVGFDPQSKSDPPALTAHVVKLGDVATNTPASQLVGQLARVRQAEEVQMAYAALWEA